MICTYLNHKVRNDTMEGASLKVKWLARFAHAFFSSAQGPKVFYRLWDRIAEEAQHNTTTFAIFNLDIKKDFVGDSFSCTKDE